MNALPVLIVLIFIALDVATGMLRAFATTGFDSSIMRQGFFHKVSELFTVALAVTVDSGLPLMGIQLGADFSAVCCTYLCIMEIGSILENIGQMNPELREPLSKIFAKLKGVNNNDSQ